MSLSAPASNSNHGADGTVALLVIVFAFTTQLVLSFVYRPRTR